MCTFMAQYSDYQWLNGFVNKPSVTAVRGSYDPALKHLKH